MTKQPTNTGRAGVAPSLQRCPGCSRHLMPAELAWGHCHSCHARCTTQTSLALVRCAGCGAALPAGAAIVVDLMAADVRCDLCWRSLLATQAAQWRHEQADALGPQGEERDDH